MEKKLALKGGRRWPLLLFLAGAGGLLLGAVRLVHSEQAAAMSRARERLRRQLRVAAAQLQTAVTVIETRARTGAETLLLSADVHFVKPPAPRGLVPLPLPGVQAPRGRFFLDLGDLEERQGHGAKARAAWHVAALSGENALGQAQACFRLAALAARRGNLQEQRHWRHEFLARLPNLSPRWRQSREALLLRAQAQTPDKNLARDLSLLLLGPDDVVARGLLREAGLGAARVVAKRRQTLALMAALAALLPGPGDPPSGVRGNREHLLAWRRTPQGRLQIAWALEPALEKPVQLLPDHGPLPPAGGPLLVERSPSGLAGLQLAASMPRAAVTREASQRAHLIEGTVVVLLGALATAGWFSLAAWRREVAAARARTAFVAQVGHDLRTPLTCIRMYAETLAAGRVDAAQEAQGFAATIAEEAERMTALVDRVLDLSRLDAASPLLKTSVELGGLVQDVVLGLAPLTRETRVSLLYKAPEETCRVRGDPASLRGLVANLLDNALLHGGQGGVVEIQLQKVGQTITLVVADRGPGLPPGMGSRLLERFVRGPAAKGRGAGLGLAVVREVASSHGGSVAAENRPGGGARFTVRLPAS